MEPYVHLLLLGILVLRKASAGSHSLKYFDTAISLPGLGDPQFMTVGYVDDQQFVSFDSCSASQKMEPRAPWMANMDQDYWERNTRNTKIDAQFYRVDLETLRGYFNQSEEGVHTLQRLFGCEVSPDGSFKRSFYQYGYDGHDYLALDTETLTWTAIEPSALNSKRKLEAERRIAERQTAYLKKTCVQWLHKYLEMGKDALLRTDPPSAQIICRTDLDGGVILRCQAQDFYPAMISLTWLRDGEEQLQDTEFIETRPGGDGTFQKWAAVRMASGEVDKYTCRVQHVGLPEPLTLKWEPQPSSIWIIVGIIAVFLTVLIAGAVIWRKKNSDL
uniref:MHC class I antigen n=4 Tax=Monodelphis domestica TaxID=13616 RepID=Q1AG55_MONDO|nr:MHC class I antigen [Monodelphis domestica]